MTAALDMSPAEEAIVRNTLAHHLPAGIAVWAFGSRATGHARRHSDLDLALSGEGPLPPALLSQLAEAFDESDLPWKVDLLDWATTSAEFQAVIARDRVLLVAAG
jgi:type I restriction enzyme S subunit